MSLSMVIAAAALVAAPSGQAVYESTCMACHAPENVMVAAPKLRDAPEWRRRLARSAQGLDTLTEHAVKGFGAMPAKGGRDSLTQAEVRSAIVYMMGPEK
jgi:cytochrome c5